MDRARYWVKGERRAEREKIEWEREKERENVVCICILIVNKWLILQRFSTTSAIIDWLVGCRLGAYNNSAASDQNLKNKLLAKDEKEIWGDC